MQNNWKEYWDFIITGVIALILSVVLTAIGVSSFNKEAKATGSSVKGYSVWSVIIGFLTAFIVLYALIYYEFFLKSRYAR